MFIELRVYRFVGCRVTVQGSEASGFVRFVGFIGFTGFRVYGVKGLGFIGIRVKGL